jgi:hypothetical protein
MRPASTAGVRHDAPALRSAAPTRRIAGQGLAFGRRINELSNIGAIIA